MSNISADQKQVALEKLLHATVKFNTLHSIHACDEQSYYEEDKEKKSKRQGKDDMKTTKVGDEECEAEASEEHILDCESDKDRSLRVALLAYLANC